MGIRSPLLELMFEHCREVFRSVKTICATVTIIISIYQSLLHWIEKIMRFDYYLINILNVKIMAPKDCLHPARSHDQTTTGQEVSIFTTQLVMSRQWPRNCARSHVMVVMSHSTNVIHGSDDSIHRYKQ